MTIVNAMQNFKHLDDSYLNLEENKQYYDMIRNALWDSGIVDKAKVESLSNLDLIQIYLKIARRCERALTLMNQNIFLAGNDT